MAVRSESHVSLTPWQRLKVVLSAEHADLWVLLVHGLAAGVLSLVVPLAVQSLVSTSAFGTVLQPMMVLALVVFGLLLLAGGLRLIQVLVAERIQERLFARMAIDLAHRLPRVRMEAYDKHRGTELVNRFMDVMTIQKGTALILQDGFALVLQALVGMVLLAFYSPLLLGFDLLLLASMALVIFGLGRGAVRTSIAESYAKYDTAAWLEELARVPLAFKSPSAAALALRRADERTRDYLAARRAHFRMLLRQVFGSLLLQAVASGLLLGIGGWLVARGQLTLGQLVAAELIVTPVVYSFARFGKHLESFYDLLSAVDKVGSLFDLPRERTGGERLPAASGRPAGLRMRMVDFTHAGRTSPVLRDVDFTVEPGSRVAVLGPHSSGKSTLLELAAGLRDPRSGAVEFDGVDLREVLLDDVRGQLALVRGIQLFDGSVLDNVRLGREELSLHDVRQALEAVQLLEELTHLSEGLQTQLSGGHSLLSTGQAQRLMLARAMVGRPRLLLLDEALDSLDIDVRGPVVDALLDRSAPWTLVLTTHVPEIARRCERVLRMEDGKAVEVGSP